LRGVELLHPDLRAAAYIFNARCRLRGLEVLITETLRTAAEQDALYAKGRTGSGSIVTYAKGSEFQSPHQWGVAFDFCRNVKGREYDNRDGFFVEVGRVVNELKIDLGLFWGGDFKGFVDMPHVEMIEHMPNNSTSALKKKYGAPEKFMDSWAAYPPEKKEAATVVIYRKLADVPEWGRPTIRMLIEKKAFAGTGEDLDISEDMLRVFVVNDRLGLYGKAEGK